MAHVTRVSLAAARGLARRSVLSAFTSQCTFVGLPSRAGAGQGLFGHSARRCQPSFPACRHFSSSVVNIGLDEVKKLVQEAFESFETLECPVEEVEQMFPKGVEILMGKCPKGDLADAAHIFGLCGPTTAQAMFCSGLCYYSGIGVTQDRDLGRVYMRDAYHRGYSVAAVILYRTRDKSSEVEADDAEILIEAARRGVTEAEYLLATAYIRGDTYIMQDPPLAFQYAQLGAKKGHAGCKALLGRMCLEGIGVPINVQEGYRLSKEASDEGDIEGMFQTAICLIDIHGVDRDIDEATRLLTLCHNQGHMPATGELGISHWSGRGVDRDADIAIRYLTLSADAGYAPAQMALADAYIEGEGVDKNMKLGMHYLNLAKQEDADVQVDIGVRHSQGLHGYPLDSREALRLWTLAAKNKLHGRARCRAMYLVGLGLLFGEGAEKQPEKALELFAKSCQAGFKPACEHLMEIKKYLGK